MSTTVSNRSCNATSKAAREERELEVLRLIARRFNTIDMLERRTGYSQKMISRYTLTLIEDGFITRKRDSAFGAQGAWFWRYAVTEAGRDAIRAL